MIARKRLYCEKEQEHTMDVLTSMGTEYNCALLRWKPILAWSGDNSNFSVSIWEIF